MRRSFVVVLAFIVVVAVLAPLVIFYMYQPQVTLKPQVGIFFYAWYNPAYDYSWKKSEIVDQPVLGYYNSSDPEIIEQQLLWIEELGVDFVVISWWGFDDEYEKFIDNATKLVFETAQSINSSLKFAIMVEPTHSRNDSTMFGLPYDYSGIYNHVYGTFVEPYSDLYFNCTGKPLICFFNDGILTPDGVVPSDNRFTITLVGAEPYVQWIYTYLTGQVQNPNARQTSVTPRYGNSVDVNLTEGTYDEQWQNALKLVREGKVDTILITSWNEYPERHAIEPHYDGTAADLDPYFLYTKTKQYIRQLHSYELNLQIHSEDYNALTPSHLLDLGATWVRMDYEINKTESVMTALHNKGYNVLAIIDSRTREFITLEDWNNTLLSIVSNPVSQIIDAWEIWNEPNSVNGSYVSPSDYREMLRCAYSILKNSTNGLVISGGLAPHDNFATYLDQAFGDSDTNGYYDFFGLHLYSETIPENLAFIEEAKAVTDKGVWVTEMGRPSHSNEGAENFTEDGQATYIVNNLVGICPEVERVFVYELYDYKGEPKLVPDKENYFGLLTLAYAKKQAYYDLKGLRRNLLE
jgi:hypothetical protein